MGSLAIARIFGGFPSSFYSTYHEYRPKSKPVEEYEQRMQLYELFHYLNHTLLFGVSRRVISVSKLWQGPTQQGNTSADRVVG
jgi:protein-ribulosamine 3-kinase